jgi:hypothetical protein
MPAVIKLCVTCLVFYFYITRLISCISILTCITTLELPYGSAFMKINGALSRKKKSKIGFIYRSPEESNLMSARACVSVDVSLTYFNPGNASPWPLSTSLEMSCSYSWRSYIKPKGGFTLSNPKPQNPKNAKIG